MGKTPDNLGIENKACVRNLCIIKYCTVKTTLSLPRYLNIKSKQLYQFQYMHEYAWVVINYESISKSTNVVPTKGERFKLSPAMQPSFLFKPLPFQGIMLFFLFFQVRSGWLQFASNSSSSSIWSEWRLTVITATVRIALVDILDLSEVDIPAGVFLHPAVGWG